MKIALLTDGIHPYVIGGMQRHSFYLAKYLAKNNVQVDLYHTNQSSYDISKFEFFSEEEKKNINSFVIAFPDLGIMPGHYIRASYEYSSRIYDLFIKNSNVDFIYVKGFSGWKLIEEKRKGFNCAPIGINFHGYEMFQKPSSLKSKLENVLLLKSPVLFNVRNSDYVFSYGGKITNIIKALGIPEEKIIEAPAGIEREWLNESIKFPKQKRKFVFVGRYERRKGIEELNRSLKALIIKYDFEFHFIGNIPNSKKLVSDKIIYYDLIADTEQLKILLDSFDILVCPSHSEGMPNVILEAMARGLAIIATDVGAVNCLVNSDNGWLIPFSSVENISNAMTAAISLNDSDLQKMKQNALSHIRNSFLWENISKQLIEKLKSIIHS